MLDLQIRGLTIVINIDKFRYRLTRQIVNCYVAFVKVKNSNFQNILKSINSLINNYLVRLENTIHNQIENNFIKTKRLIQNKVIA